MGKSFEDVFIPVTDDVAEEQHAPAKLPRYTYERVYADGTPYWIWNPPVDAKEDGFTYEKLADGNELAAIKRANRLNDELDQWRAAKRGIKGSLTATLAEDQVEGLMAAYFESAYYHALAEHTKPRVRWSLEKAGDVELDGTPFRYWRIDAVTTRHADQLYHALVKERGETQAAHSIMKVKRLFNLAMKWGYIVTNPFSGIMMIKPKPRKVKWTKEQVHAFINKAMSNDLWVPLGIAAMIGYDTGQRVTDLRVLEWDEVNFDAGRLELTQSKRGVDVFVPLPDETIEYLRSRHAEVGGKYVCANPRTGEPFEATHFAKTAARVRDAAGLPSHLRLADLRRTVATELGESGATMHEIMSVGGWQDPRSAKPYVRTNAEMARNGMAKRRKEKG